MHAGHRYPLTSHKHNTVHLMLALSLQAVNTIPQAEGAILHQDWDMSLLDVAFGQILLRLHEDMCRWDSMKCISETKHIQDDRQAMFRTQINFQSAAGAVNNTEEWLAQQVCNFR